MFLAFCFNSSCALALEIYSIGYFLSSVDLKLAIRLVNIMFLFQIFGTVTLIFIADRYTRSGILLKCYLMLSFILGFLAYASHLKNFAVQVALIWAYIYFYGMSSAVIWMVLPEYLPDQLIGFVVLALMLGIFV
jgi:hypothetical protein